MGEAQLPESLLSGDNAAFLDEQYRVWQTDPEQVAPHWRRLFEGLGAPASNDGRRAGDLPRAPRRSIFHSSGPAAGVVRAIVDRATEREARVVQLINAYRVRGHMEADIDPLGRRERVTHPELTLDHYGLTEADLDVTVPTAPLFGLPGKATLREIVAHLRACYCGTIGAEFMNIQDQDQKRWVLEFLEHLPMREVLDRGQELRVLRKLSDAENFERMLHTRFPGTKRFSLEGAETLIPLLDLVIAHAARQGGREIVFGMAHRGRLNTLVNILEKPVRAIVEEFQDMKGGTQGSGDVKYHLGYSADTVTQDGHPVHLSLTPNPSHLEAVDPIVEGRVRAKQDRVDDRERRRCMPLLIHGDAAFSGQGLVMEVLNLSELSGYRTGGTIHVIVNNQIGFTTPPHESRSTPYATDIARMLGVPILHVNGEDPRAVAAVVELAVDWRFRFRRDVVIDMYCYRKHGHNEGDEPSFTQPLMYDIIRSRPTPREQYARHLVARGGLSQEDVDRVDLESLAEMNAAADRDVPARIAPATERVFVSKGSDPDVGLYVNHDRRNAMSSPRPRMDDATPGLKGLWSRYGGTDIHEAGDTGFPLERLAELLTRANQVPDGFTPHAKIRRLLQQRQEMIEGQRQLDWAMGEQAAWATLLAEGHPVRLSGQDSGRGTFSHRHALWTDIRTGDEYFPLDHVGTARFQAIDSSLSEAAVLGFEVGYAFDTPDGLVSWEAQFGDFVNGAQIIIDQFIVAAEQKWNRRSGIVLLLPHGYEGQGPEHSSARIERFLQMVADDNIQVANVTTPAQIFHLLRRQVHRTVRKPLVVATPKSLLRHAEAVSTMEDLASGTFRAVLDDPTISAPEQVRRVVLCSGKVYYDLVAHRREVGHDGHVALVRVELLAPYPQAAIAHVLGRYPSQAEVVWCQEEPKNMGAWPMYLQWMVDHLTPARLPRYVGRPAAASPATGSHKKHVREQQALLDAALRLD